MTEKQGDHRREVERELTLAEIRRAGMGMHYALIVTGGFLLTSCVYAWIGHSVEGASILGATLLSLVVAFLQGTKSRRGGRPEEHVVREEGPTLPREPND